MIILRLLLVTVRTFASTYLLNAIQPLLGRAFRHAIDAFDDQPGVVVCGIQGNSHHLPR